MNLFDALGAEIGREFQAVRDTIPEQYWYAADALPKLIRFATEKTCDRRALVLFDERTRQVAGDRAARELSAAGWHVEQCLVVDGPGHSFPVCDDSTKARIQASLPPCSFMLAVGSGVINDLTKWLAAEACVPYAVFATAASMNGYAAANVAPSLGGVKSLFRARAPIAIAAEPSIICAAPAHLASSGLGDLVAKPVSTADWLLNHLVMGEAFSWGVARIINAIEGKYATHPERVAVRDPEAISALFDALVFSGCAMTLQGSSLPASGGEHLISHTLDMASHVHGVAHDLHGRQVGVGTIVAAGIYERAMAIDCPSFEPNCISFDPAYWGEIAPAVRVEHDAKIEKLKVVCEALRQPGMWNQVRAQLRPMLPSSSQIRDCLRRAGAAYRASDIGCTREHLIDAIIKCPSIRSRFTSIDLGFVLGILPNAAHEIVDQSLL